MYLLKRVPPAQLLPAVRLGWLVHDISDAVLVEAAAAGVHQLCPRANIVSQAEVTKALQAGFSVRGWGIKDTEVTAPDLLSRASVTVTLPAHWPDECSHSPTVDGWTQLLLRMKASGAQGCTVDWPDRAEAALRKACYT